MMKTRRNGMTRPEVLVVIAIVAVTIVLTIGLHNLYIKYIGHSDELHASVTPPRRSSVRSPGWSTDSTPTNVRRGGFRPAHRLRHERV